MTMRQVAPPKTAGATFVSGTGGLAPMTAQALGDLTTDDYCCLDSSGLVLVTM